MKKSILSLLAAGAILINSVSLNAQEKGDKKDPAKTMVTQFMKQLEKAELNKINEVYDAVLPYLNAESKKELE